jgi:Tol biopolymer transport system component
MPKMITHMFSIVIILATTVAFGSCEDNPVRPKPSRTVPDCWSPLVVDTVGHPDPAPSQAQSSPVWSNSGKLVAYFSFYDSCNVRDLGIYVADSSRGAFRRKIPVFGAYCQWLPGDSELIVNTGFGGAGELVLYNLNTDSAMPLGIQTRFPMFDVSRDGRYIYYEGEPTPPHRGASIYEYDRVSGTEWAVVQGAVPGISPDGKYLAFVVGPLFLYTFSDSTIRELAPSAGLPDWTSDSKHIVHDDRFGKLFITDLSGNSRFVTGEHESFAGVSGPISISPDGTRILYKHLASDFFRHIWETNLDGILRSQFSY